MISEQLKEALETKKTYITSNINIVTFLMTKGVLPYNSTEDRNENHKGIRIFFYGNSSKLRAYIYEYYNNLDTNGKPCDDIRNSRYEYIHEYLKKVLN